MLTRNQQIASLQRSVPSAQSRAQDNHLFEVGLRLSDGKVLTLRIELGPDFPQTAPVLRIMDVGVTHEWLDSSGRVAGLNVLYNWNACSSDLGSVVQYALSQFCIKPPHVAAVSASSASVRTSPLPPPPRASSSSAASSPALPPNNNNNNNSSARMEPVEIPSDFAELDQLSPAQLEELMTSESAFSAMFDSLAVTSNLAALKQSVSAENTARALKNVAQAQLVEDASRRVSALHSQLERQRARLAELMREEEAGRPNPRRFADEIEHFARVADDESEAFLVNEWGGASSSSSTAEDFEVKLARYRALRVQYHAKKAKAELCRHQFTT